MDENEQNFIEQILKKSNVQVRDIVINFMQENKNNFAKINYELTLLILRSCNTAISVPENLVNECLYDSIFNLLEKQITDHFDIPYKIWENLIEFFTVLFSENWTYFSNDGKFDSYLCMLVEKCSKSKCRSLRMLCAIIRLKQISALLNNDCIILQNYLAESQKYAEKLLKTLFFEKYRKIWQFTLQELQTWFLKSKKFLNDTFLKYIIYSLKDRFSNRVVISALEISIILLSTEEFHQYLNLFVQKLFSKFIELAPFENNQIFKLICECCQLLFIHFKDVQIQKIMEQILSNLFDDDRCRAKIAVQLWITIIDQNTLASLQTIINFISDRNGYYIELLVDSLINDYPLITDWPSLAKILAEEGQLTTKEKSILVTLILFSVQQSVTGRLPYNLNSLNHLSVLGSNSKACQQITSAFTPFMESILNIHYPPNIMSATRSQLLKIISFFDFNLLNSSTLSNLSLFCAHIFESSICLPELKTSLNVLLIIDNDTKISSKFISQLRSYFQDKFLRQIRNILTDPSKFEQNDDKRFIEDVTGTMVRLHCLNLELLLDKEVAFGIPIVILNTDLFNSRTLLPICELSIYMCHRYVIQDVEQHVPEIKVLVKSLNENLKLHFINRLGESIFLALCSIAITLAIAKFNDAELNELFPESVKYRMATYISVAVCDIDEQYHVNMNATRKKVILKNYLAAIESGILQLNYAYDVLVHFPKNRLIMEKTICNFIEQICIKKNGYLIAKWLIELLIFHFEITVPNDSSVKDVLGLSKQINHILYSIRYSVQYVIKLMHIIGIEYSIVDDKDLLRINFLYVLAELSECLDKPNRLSLLKYFEVKNAFNVEVMKYYLKSLRKTYKSL